MKHFKEIDIDIIMYFEFFHNELHFTFLSVGILAVITVKFRVLCATFFRNCNPESWGCALSNGTKLSSLFSGLTQ
jgi:hypothetical protein